VGRITTSPTTATPPDAPTRPHPAGLSHPAGVGEIPVPSVRRRPHGLEKRYNRLFALADTLAIILAAALATLIILLMGRTVDAGRLVITVSLMIPVWFVIAYVAGLYSLVDLRISHTLAGELGKVAIAVTAWSWLLLVLRTPLLDGPIAMAGPTLRWLLTIPLMLAARTVVRAVTERRSWHVQPAALVGGKLEIEPLNERIERHPEWGLDVRSTFAFEQSDAGLATLADAIRDTGAERVVIAGGAEDHSARIRLVSELIERNLKVDIVSGGPETLYSNAVLHDLEGLPVLSVRPSNIRPFDLSIKRAFDVVVSGIGLVLAAPLIAWAALRIKLDSPGPVFFRQVRCGYRGQEFEMVKLRTMVDGADSSRQELREATAGEGNDDVMFKLEQDPRVTRAGKKLRKWSVDELPQLWNVFIGDMSMVGPRPLPMDEARQASGLFAARTRLRPGIAGPWQALGRSRIPFADMIRLDYSYATGWSMAEDLRLLVRTAGAVMRRTGAH